MPIDDKPFINNPIVQDIIDRQKDPQGGITITPPVFKEDPKIIEDYIFPLGNHVLKKKLSISAQTSVELLVENGNFFKAPINWYLWNTGTDTPTLLTHDGTFIDFSNSKQDFLTLKANSSLFLYPGMYTMTVEGENLEDDAFYSTSFLIEVIN
jgi:hypothetical protein